MNKNTSRTLGLLLIVVIVIIYFSTKKAPVAVAPNTITTPPTVVSKEVCYWKETVGTESTDEAFTSITYDEGNNVHGIINWIPGEKDSLVGDYTGTVESNTGMAGYPIKINVIYNALGEGIASKQQQIWVIGESDIKQGIGDVEKANDGVWRYKDPSHLSYNTVLPKVDCSTVPDRIKKDYSNK